MSLAITTRMRHRLLRPIHHPITSALDRACICTNVSSSRSPEIIFSGIQPTGVPHLGNWLGALQPWVRLQHSSLPGTKLIFSIVDLHALTIRQDAEQLRQWKRETLATLLAVGLNPERCTIFYQSAVSMFHWVSVMCKGPLTCKRYRRIRSSSGS